MGRCALRNSAHPLALQNVPDRSNVRPLPSVSPAPNSLRSLAFAAPTATGGGAGEHKHASCCTPLAELMNRLATLMLFGAAVLSASCKAGSDLATAYVSNEDSSDISEIDLASARVLRTIRVGSRPRGLSVSHDGRSLDVALSGSTKPAPTALMPSLTEAR
jgi:YVTN family beta-propeller protein